MNILSAIGYNTQSNLKTAAGCGTEREQRHSTGGILKWQKIMSLKTENSKNSTNRSYENEMNSQDCKNSYSKNSSKNKSRNSYESGEDTTSRY